MVHARRIRIEVAVEAEKKSSGHLSRHEHIQRHVDLHRSLDELTADFIRHTDRLLAQASILELIQWSFMQTRIPNELEVS